MRALEIKNLHKSFLSNFFLKKYHILKGIDLKVEQGEIYGFLGPNGAGKTTTIKCIIGLIFPDCGEIMVNGLQAHSLELRHKLGFLPENPYFYDYLTARELLTFSARLFNIPKKEGWKIIDKLIALVGLSGKEHLKLNKFSKGMLQRIGLAQALINSPDILILDEPFSGLDPIGRKELRDIIVGFRNSGKTVFFSSHILQDMELMVEKVGIIFDGRIIREGKLSDLVSHSVLYYEVVFSDIDEGKIKPKMFDYVSRDRNYIVKCQNIQQVNKIIEFIILNKGRIEAVTPIKMTLEDIFLKEIQE
jgi:ABC-2 type transport system ATP-binding protein